MNTFRSTSRIVSAAGLWLLVFAAFGIQAAPAAVGQGKQGATAATALDALSASERQKYHAAREKVLTQSPSLAAGEEELRGLQRKVQVGKISKELALAKMRSHRDKMDAALRKVKPSIVPILDKLDATTKERAGKHAKSLKAAAIQ